MGHNNGPSLEAGYAWRKHAWRKARADLIPRLPIEILRNRVKRAKELGLPYKTYASVRASTGRDVVGFLFSNNALGIMRADQELGDHEAQRLAAIRADFAALSHAPLPPEILMSKLAAKGLVVAADRAPHFAQAWADIRSAVQAPLRRNNLPPDGVLVIGVASFERDWSEAGKLAGYIPADQYFA